MPIKPEAFVAIEETMAYTVGLEWYHQLAPYVGELLELIGQRQYSAAHMLIDTIRFDNVVPETRQSVEELGVSALLFGAAQAAGGEVDKTSFVAGRQTLPPALQQAIDQYAIMTGRFSGEMLRTRLHAVVAELEEEAKAVALGKEDISAADLEAGGGLANPEQSGLKRTLYVSRKLINSADVLAWAREQGFKKMLDQSDLHVTVCFSRDELEWPLATGHAPELRVVGGERYLTRLGKAVALLFESPELDADHADFRAAGASHDWPDYLPHLSISYDEGPFDFENIEPYRGELIFGPEEFAEIKSDWEPKETILKADRQTLAQMLNDAVLEGKKMVDIGANLTTSRLVQLGFLAEATDAGIEQYQVNEVLDEVTCDVCRHMHGKVFNVQSEYSRLITVLSTSDPAELKHLAPWPSNTKAGLESLRGKTTEQMQTEGLGSPPYHPNCRGFLSLVGTVTADTKMQGVVPADLVEPDPFDVLFRFEVLRDSVRGTKYAPADIAIIDQYTGNLHQALNGALRRGFGMDPDYRKYLKEQIKLLDKAVGKLKTKEEIVTYRGVSQANRLFGTDDLTTLVGKRITDKGFVSTTALREYAEELAENGGAIMEIHVPKGIRYAIPEAVPGVMVTLEREILLERGLEFEVLHVDTSGAIPKMKLRIVGKLKKDEEGLSDQVTKAETSRFVWQPGDVTISY